MGILPLQFKEGFNRKKLNIKGTELFTIIDIEKGINPRAEINSSDETKKYLDMGVRHFSVGTDITILYSFWKNEGEKIIRALQGE